MEDKKMLKIEELVKEAKSYITDIVGGDSIVDYYNYDNYIEDSFCNIADNYVDIYTYDLLEWLKNNYDEFEDYMDEFVPNINGKFDLISYIRNAQYIAYNRELNNGKNSILNFLSYYVINKELKFEEITEEQKNNIENIDFENIDTFEELAEEIKEALGIEEE